jgi:osmotically-inducible protein OsmY
MKVTGKLAVAFTWSFLLLGSSCQTMRREATVKIPSTETPQDEALSNVVRDRLLAVNTADLTSVRVISSSGTVYLAGTVKSLDARQQAIKTAWNAPGVQSVVNSLEVQ